MNKILISTRLDNVAISSLDRAGYDIVQNQNLTLRELVQTTPDAIGLIVSDDNVGAEVIDLLPKLKLIVRAGVGVNTIDIAYARQKNIDVMDTPGANSNAVAEEVIALILANYRHIIEGDHSSRMSKWNKENLMGIELTGKTVGIVGLGKVGRLVAKRLSGFEPVLLGNDPVLAPSKARELGVELCTLEEIFTRCDIVTIHVPDGIETKNLIGASLLKLLKPKAVLVNCAHYGIVDEEALRGLRTTGKSIQYLTDVCAEEIICVKNVADVATIMLPRLGTYTLEAQLKAGRRAAEQLIAYFQQGITNYVVNKDTPDGLSPEYQWLAWLLATVSAKMAGGRSSVRQIECTFYGDLHPYGRWFMAPILKGLTHREDKGMMPEEAMDLLHQQGITVLEREPKKLKNYGNSITLDLMTDDGYTLHSYGVRGTMTDGHPMISRMGNFEGLYFEMKGNMFFARYEDRPGVIAQISSMVAEAGINIENIAAPRDPKEKTSLAVLRTDKLISEELVKEIAKRVKAFNAFTVAL